MIVNYTIHLFTQYPIQSELLQYQLILFTAYHNLHSNNITLNCYLSNLPMSLSCTRRMKAFILYHSIYIPFACYSIYVVNATV